MEHITQVMPADGWFAVYESPETPRRIAPLAGWALTNPPAEWRGLSTPNEQLLVGMVIAGKGVRLVDPEEQDFIGYQGPGTTLHLEREDPDDETEDRRISPY